MSAALAALRSPLLRTYLTTFAATSTGTWMRSIAQDWLVLRLTHDPAAVGVTMACQFLPVLLLGLHGGLLADRLPRRTLLLGVECANAVLASVLATLTLTGVVGVVHVDLIALAGGLALVVGDPARQSFVTQLVPAEHLRAAVALAAATFQSARLVGPAAAAVLIDTAGTGWVFVATAGCSLLALAALTALPRTVAPPVVAREPGQVRAALRHVAARPAVAATIALVGVLGMVGLNFPVVLTGMAEDVFGGGAVLYGVFNAVLAIGSVAGALAATRLGPDRPGSTRLWPIVVTAAGFGAAQLAASQASERVAFLVMIALMGALNLAFQALANSAVQLGVDAAVRGRVMGLYAVAFTGGTPLGAPLVGWVTDTFGPRAGMAFCGAGPLVAAGLVGAVVVLDTRRHACERHTTAVLRPARDAGVPLAREPQADGRRVARVPVTALEEV